MVDSPTRMHIGGVLALGLSLAIAACSGRLDPSVKLTDGNEVASWKTPSQVLIQGVHQGLGTAKLLFALMSIAAFGGGWYLANTVEEAERIDTRFRQQAEDAEFARRQAIAQKEIAKYQLDHDAEIQAHGVVAESRAREYFADSLGLPVDVAFSQMPEEVGAGSTGNTAPADTAPPVSTKSTEQSAPNPLKDSAVTTVAESPVTVEAPSTGVFEPIEIAAVVVHATPISSAIKLLDDIVVTTRSTVFASATGTGKSVSEAYILNRFLAKFLQSEIWAIAQKNDSFQGLREQGRVALFDSSRPQEAFNSLERVYSLFERRRHAPEDRRAEFKTKPVRLILSDWHSIYDCCKKEKWYQKNYATKLSTLITVGREFNTCLLVDTQSYNVASLGITEDSNIRNNVNILCQGYQWTDDEGQEHGDFNMISNLLNNRYLVPTGADKLHSHLADLKIQSEETKTPVIFSSVGNRLELLPDLRKFKE